MLPRRSSRHEGEKKKGLHGSHRTRHEVASISNEVCRQKDDARARFGNIDQIAVRANSGGRVYDDDIAEIKEGVDQLLCAH